MRYSTKASVAEHHNTIVMVKDYRWGPPGTTAPATRSSPTAAWNRAGTLRRVRRMIDLSQRQLAERIHVAPATIARAEMADEPVSLAVVEAILAEAGLRIVVVDAQHNPLPPMREDAARNHGGRRYPAHLDARIPTSADEPLGGWRPDRPKPRLTFHHRYWRNQRRRRCCVIPRDHSSEIELRLARHLHPRRLPEWARRAPIARLLEQGECRCGPRCETYCIPRCRCQCEPIGCDSMDLGGGYPPL
jgi:HTH-type transcriptional regulator/antitoxin HipB